MSSIMSLWRDNKELFKSKSIHQLISFMGNGNLTDNSQTSKEFRELLDIIPSEFLVMWANQCLEQKFDNNGLVLQDIVNQIGTRLGFNVEYGVYRGNKNKIGYDGIWKSIENYSIIVEVKTTDAYRINLDTLYEYRKKLIEKKQISMEHSSILIIVGRKDTGDLEAQIRGSRHAWDIRLISTDALLNLLKLKEKLNDLKTSLQINSILKPMEYTKLDTLIDLIFTTAKDMELDDEVDVDMDVNIEHNKKDSKVKNNPVNFHEKCVDKIEERLNLNFHKQSRTSYLSNDKKVGMTLAVSKVHPGGSHDAKYWFAFHPHQRDFLNNYQHGLVTFGCGDSENIFGLEFSKFKDLLQFMWTTDNEKRMYWHVVIYQDNNKFSLQLPKRSEFLDLSEYKI